jgi:hypothetical protein
MPKAVTAGLVFTISLKRSTQNLQLSTRTPADYPVYGGKAHRADISECPLMTALADLVVAPDLET